MHADNSDHLKKSVARRSEAARARALAAIATLLDDDTAVTFTAIAKRAGVSRAFLYANADVRERVIAARNMKPIANAVRPDVRASDNSLLVRLEQAHARNAGLRRENRQLRAELATALHHQRAERIGR